MAEWYDTAQFCLNGHVINIEYDERPAKNKPFCPKCGANTITQCQNCGSHIQGYHHSQGPSYPGYTAPKFCHNCGVPYPWTESRLSAARGLVNELAGLTDDEKQTLNKSLDDIVKDTPNRETAIVKIKKILPRLGQEVAEALREILVDILSDSVRKALWGQ